MLLDGTHLAFFYHETATFAFTIKYVYCLTVGICLFFNKERSSCFSLYFCTRFSEIYDVN